MSAVARQVSEIGLWWQVVSATSATSFKRMTAYLINVVRIPIFPAGMFLTSYVAWNAAGVEAIDGVNVSGFLLAGMIGLICWSSSVWWSGSAIENERYEGTIAALFLTPASRVAVVIGHGLGGLLYMVPSFAVVGLLGVITGARLNIDSLAAVVLSLLALVASSLAMGFLLASFFILTRRANLMANIIQHPLYLVGGFMVPRDQLPIWLFWLSQAMPIAHAVDAFRASMLSSASLDDVSNALLATLLTSSLFVLIGILGIRKVEHVAKRSGQLDLF
ncbi:MAG TPA: ABC transporter permease [Thermomicrobiales bacterium]|nr:ABC transporter permease [Thermomicrobiales bacterium]